MSYTPNTEQVRDAYTRAMRNAFIASAGEHQAEFDRWLNAELARAWDEGHKHRQRRGMDDCHCSAWDAGECACGRFGTGPLLSMSNNPYRTGDPS